MATLDHGSGWGSGWGDPYSGAQRMTGNMSATIAPETTKVEGFEWVVIPSIVLLVSPNLNSTFADTIWKVGPKDGARRGGGASDQKIDSDRREGTHVHVQLRPVMPTD